MTPQKEVAPDPVKGGATKRGLSDAKGTTQEAAAPAGG
jgi:hypothetical protein